MKSALVRLLVLVASLAVSGEAWAAACTEGVDCFCECVKGPDAGGANAGFKSAACKSKNFPVVANAVFCEDFEDAVLRERTPGQDDGWATRYGGVTGECFNPAYLGNGVAGDGVIGSYSESPNYCANIVTDGVCDIPGQTECSFDGGWSFLQKVRPDLSGGTVGTFKLRSSIQTDHTPLSSGTRYKNIGITYAMRYSTNAVMGGPAWKHNEWGDSTHGMNGVTTGNAAAPNPPFDAFIFWSSGPYSYTASTGVAWTSSSAFKVTPSPGAYDWTQQRSRWGCYRWQYENLGETNARQRMWFAPEGGSETLLIDATVNLSQMGGPGGTEDRSGIDNFIANTYYNGANCPGGAPGPDCGAPGSEPFGRFEDNMIVTSGTPVLCSAIGFNVGGAICGNASVETGEQCDDGQLPPVSGDGCSDTCTIEGGLTPPGPQRQVGTSLSGGSIR